MGLWTGTRASSRSSAALGHGQHPTLPDTAGPTTSSTRPPGQRWLIWPPGGLASGLCLRTLMPRQSTAASPAGVAVTNAASGPAHPPCAVLHVLQALHAAPMLLHGSLRAQQTLLGMHVSLAAVVPRAASGHFFTSAFVASQRDLRHP